MGRNRFKENCGSKTEFIKCTYCKLTLSGDNFWKGRRKCFSCQIRGDTRRNIVDNIKEARGCSNCEIKGPACIFDFHHIQPGKKDYAISTALHISGKLLLEELVKCTVLCANCHRMLHDKKKKKLVDKTKLTKIELTDIEIYAILFCKRSGLPSKLELKSMLTNFPLKTVSYILQIPHKKVQELAAFYELEKENGFIMPELDPKPVKKIWSVHDDINEIISQD